MRFRYLRDPLFLLALSIYFANRFVFKRVWSSGFAQDHMNDLICVAFWVPPLVWVQSRFGFRPGDEPPSGFVVTIASPTETSSFANRRRGQRASMGRQETTMNEPDPREGEVGLKRPPKEI